MNKIVTRPKGFEVKTTAKAGGFCNEWAPANQIDIYNGTDPWCEIKGNWEPAHVARSHQGGQQECCVNWQD